MGHVYQWWENVRRTIFTHDLVVDVIASSLKIAKVSLVCGHVKGVQ